jgi:hypothetical protein
MTFVTTLDVYGMSPQEYRAVLDYMGVEERPATGIYLHLTTATDFGYRIVEIWDRKEGFEEFLDKRLAPATKALGIDRKTVITIKPLHNFFGPRLSELPCIVDSLRGGTTSPFDLLNQDVIALGGSAPPVSIDEALKCSENGVVCLSPADHNKNHIQSSSAWAG